MKKTRLLLLLLFISTFRIEAALADNDYKEKLIDYVLPKNAQRVASVADFFRIGEQCYSGKMTNVYYISVGSAALFWSSDSRHNCILSKLDLEEVKPGQEGATCFITKELYQQLFTPWVRDASKNYDQDKKLNNQVIIDAKRAIYYCFSMAPISLNDIKNILGASQ